MWWRAGMNEWTEGSVYGWRAVGGQRKDQVCVVKNRLNELVLPCLLVSYCLSGSGGHRNSLHVVERNWSRRNLKLKSGTNEINKIKKTAVKFGVCHLRADAMLTSHTGDRCDMWFSFTGEQENTLWSIKRFNRQDTWISFFCVLYVCVFVFKSFSIPPEILKAPQRMAFCMKRLQYPSNNTQPGFVKIF